ncbi:MAG: (2Fe-2S)-binding protein [Rhizobiales bacterium]|nr:(2Fe-2S)-binding protein [Hyphomicrobiales bacterium]OJY42155.1 MAG: bacterioferritin [Rhizobiales bacterium 64-17]
MIVCSCNVISDEAVRTACRTRSPRTPGQVYGCLGCSAQCGRCARSIRKIMDDALVAAKQGCPVGCTCCAHDKANDKAHDKAPGAAG